MNQTKLDAVLRRLDEASDEKVAKVRALYERAGTPGERAAAKAALERMGHQAEKSYVVSRDQFKPTLWLVKRSDGKSTYIAVERAPTEKDALSIARQPSTYWR